MLNPKEIKSFIRKIIYKLPYGRKLFQGLKSIYLLRIRTFRLLFLEVNKNDICIDIGAHFGDASLVMWFKGARKIYSLDPNIEAFNALKKNISGIDNIYPLNIAISSETKKENLYLHKDIKNESSKDKILWLSQASSLLSDKTNIGDQFYEVQAKSLIDFFNQLEESPTIIKCDIEGAEYLIYKQLIECARLFKIRKIFLECHAKKYHQYKRLHNDFINLIRVNQLENTFVLSYDNETPLNT